MRILFLELKRVMKSKLTWILLFLALLLSLLLAWLPTTYCYSNYTDEDGNEVNLTGLASIAYEKERQADAAGIVTPGRGREAVEVYQTCLSSYGVTESYDLPEGVYEREILPIAPLLHGVKEAFADPDTGMAPAIMEIDPEQIAALYPVWQSYAWHCKAVCRLFDQHSCIRNLCRRTYSGGRQSVRMGMYPDIYSDDVLHCGSGRHGHRGPSVSICCCRAAFHSGFREFYAVPLCRMQKHCVICGSIPGILHCTGGHFHDGAG